MTPAVSPAPDPARAAFLRRICENPADDTVRLVFADWLEENAGACATCGGHGGWSGGPLCPDCHGYGDRRDRAAHAEFIRVQIELERIGPPRRRLGVGMAGAACVKPVGPDYWEFVDGDDGFAVGERVDVVVHPASLKGRKTKTKILRGVVITRVEDRGSDGVYYVVKRDAASGPWAGVELADRERELFDAANHPGGFLDAFTVGPLTTEWRRGFPFRVTMLAADFLRHAAVIFADHPITAVTLSDRVPDENVHTAPSWTWWEGEALRDWSGANPTDVPAEVFALIEATAILDFGDLRKSFGSPAEAHRALSVACVRYGRSLAGLPALPTTTTETRP